MLKSKVIKIFVIGFCMMGLTACTSADRGSFDDIYEAASIGDQSYLTKLKSEGFYLDVSNEDGDTPLCAALKNSNMMAYNTLRSLGASKNIRCRVVQVDGTTSSLPNDYAYGLTQTKLLSYTPDHNPPQKQYPKTMNNSVITGTILSLAVIVGVILAIAL